MHKVAPVPPAAGAAAKVLLAQGAERGVGRARPRLLPLALWNRPRLLLQLLLLQVVFVLLVLLLLQLLVAPPAAVVLAPVALLARMLLPPFAVLPVIAGARLLLALPEAALSRPLAMPLFLPMFLQPPPQCCRCAASAAA